jgi:hypothetical protein
MQDFSASRVIRAVKRRLQPPVPAATGPVEVQSRHLSPAVAATVAAWFRDEITQFELSGDRSVLVAHPEDPERRLKIKGAGFQGEPLGFDRRHWSGLRAPRFDFEGRMSEDVASGHDAAYRGGATFQQAVVEYEVTARLRALGYPTVPCLGHGQVTRGGRDSWFSVFELQARWRSFAASYASGEGYAAQTTAYGAQVLELATQHRLIGYFWYVVDPADGSLMIKDVHPFYTADPINMSRLTWTMQVLYAIHIVALTTILVPALKQKPDLPEHAQAYAFRSLVPDATAEEHEALRWRIVGPYMRGVPKDFSPRRLHDELKANRITAALLERCPPEFAALPG